jgi:hypothetical protein
MKPWIAAPLAAFIGLAAMTAPLPGQSPQGPTGAPAANPGAVRQLVEDYYIRQFQIRIEPTDEQWNRVLPLIRRFIQGRFQNAQQREKALAELENASESDIPRLNEVIDQTSRQATNIDTNFVRNIDPILTPNQQRKLRQFHNNIWPQIQQMITKAREQVQREQQEKLERQQLRGQRQQQAGSGLKQQNGSKQPKNANRLR